MSRKKRVIHFSERSEGQPRQRTNEDVFRELLSFVLPDGELFSKTEFHGNIKWVPEQLAAQALIWSWQDSKCVTAAFVKTLEVCERIHLENGVKTYTGFMDAVDRYRVILGVRLRSRYQELAEEVGGRFFRTDGRVLIAFDGSRATAPRSVANENAFCAPNYGHGKEARYGKKKSKGLRRKRNKAHKTEPQEPQVWITMMWHMELRLPWTWRLGPSSSSERGHVQEILGDEDFPENTMFCGDAGFVGYPIWKSILDAGTDFLIRVGANVNLLVEQVDIQKLRGGKVLCWPKAKIKSGQPPLKLRLVQIKLSNTKMWMLTSVLDPKQLTKKQIVRYYKMRWGVEVEYRGLKQTIDKHKLRCRNCDRLLAELDWALRGMAIAELLALRHQISPTAQRKMDYTPQDRSLAKTLQALRKCMRNLDTVVSPKNDIIQELAEAVVQRYNNRTDKRARYRPKNPDIKPLGDPEVRTLTAHEREKLRSYRAKNVP